jgi:diguanylate cyclase (GGDEF)-like protein
VARPRFLVRPRSRKQTARRRIRGISFWLALGAFLAALTPASSEATRSAAETTRWAAADTVFKHVADDNDLPNAASPFALAEDGDGFLWVGSDDGLARYDGHRFRAYEADPNAADTLPDNTIVALHTDSAGRLWIGTNAGGLARYDRDRDRFVRYPVGAHGLSNPSIFSIAGDGDRGLWIGTGGGLDHLDPASGRIERIRRAHDSGSLPDNVVHALLLDRSGALWVGTRAGLVRRARGARSFTAIRLSPGRGAPTDVLSLLEDRVGRIWIGTAGHGAFVLEPGKQVARALHETSGAVATELETERIGSIVEASASEVWLGTLDDGIIGVDSRTLRTRRIRHDPSVPSSPLDDIVHVLYRDRAGLIWSGTDRSLSYVNVQSAVSTVFGLSTRPRGLTDANVRSILSLPNGQTWLGLSKNGIDIFDRTGARVGGLRPNSDQPDTALASGKIFGLVAGGGRVYIGTDRGLYAANAVEPRPARLTIPGRDASAAVWALLYRQSVLWLGGEDGLWEVRPEAHGVKTLLGGATAPRLTDPRITVMALGRHQSIWIGTRNGLNRYDPRKRTVLRILPGRSSATLSAGLISCLFTGTQGGGLDILDATDARGKPRLRRIGTAEGLPNLNVDKLLDDGRGNVWASTDNGLAIIDEATLAIRKLGRADGVAITGYWLDSGTRTPAGELLYGGLGGLTIVRPRLLRNWTYEPPIVFTDIRVGGKSIRSGPYNSEETTQPVEILPAANSLLVDFSALDYSLAGSGRFAYRLVGFDKSWTSTDSARPSASYTNLPPGNYRLYVHGTDRNGSWTKQTLTLAVRVLPAWWQTVWFVLAVVCAVLGALVAFVRARTDYLRRRQRELEREVAQRTAELQATNAELAASTAELSESKMRLEALAYLDGLTELPNRRMFSEHFESTLAQMKRHGDRRFALLIIDLDRFKIINDTLGHQAGDALLIEGAHRLRAAVRQPDIVARFGGDEFAILLMEPSDYSGIEGTCQRIIDCFAEPFWFDENPMTTTASIGIATYPQSGQTQNALYRAADLALYKAKRMGRNTWRWYVPELKM